MMTASKWHFEKNLQCAGPVIKNGDDESSLKALVYEMEVILEQIMESIDFIFKYP
jgi:hypothetical protein